MLPFIRDNVTPDRKSWGTEYTHAFDDFSGGLDNRTPDLTMADKYVRDCRNMVFEDSKTLAKRNGIDLETDDQYESNVKFVGKWETNNAKVTITTSAVIIEKNGVQETLNPWTGGYYAGDIVTGCEYQNKYFIVDSYHMWMIDNTLNIWLCDDSKWTTEVVSVTRDPNDGEGEWHLDNVHTKTKMTIDEFKYRYYTETYLYNGALEYAGYVTIPAGMIGAEEDFTIKWTSQQSGAIADTAINYVLKSWGGDIWFSGITGRIPDIGNKPNQLGVMYLYQPLPENYLEGELVYTSTEVPHTVSYKPCTQELRDVFAGVSYMPKNPKLIKVHNNRLCIVGDDTQVNSVFMSDINNPFYFPTSLAFITPHAEPLNNLFEFDGALVFGGRNHIYVIYGNSTNPNSEGFFTMKEMDTYVGFMCFDCGDIIQNYYCFMGSDRRFHLLTTPTTNTEYLMVKDISRQIDLQNEPFDFGFFRNCYCQAISFEHEVYFNIWANMTNAILVYNYETMGWTYFTDWNAEYMWTDEDKVKFVAENYYTYSYQPDVPEHARLFCDKDTTVDGTYNENVAIKSRLLTKRFSPYGNVRFDFFKQILINSYPYLEVDSKIKTIMRVDNIKVNLGTIISAQPRWGNAVFGMSRFAHEGLYRSRWYQINAKGSTYSLEFKNENLNEGMKIINVNVLYKTRDVR